MDMKLSTKRSQSALEYMMTYGWAILIIVIVAVILYSMGIFNPSSSITTTSIGFSPFTVSSTVCSQAGLSVAIIGGGLPDTATQAVITKIYITSNTGTTALTKAYTLNPVIISPGKTATIVIPTVACTSANVKYSLSAKLQYSYSTSAGNVITNTTGTIAGTSSANPIVKYVPLTITSSAATPAPFQQMVIVNMNNYNSYASSNLSNIEFTYPNGTIIPSWRENGTSNSQTVLYWLKLGSFTTTTVYMDFFSTASNVLNTVNTGEAPQLTCPNPSDTASCSTYAEYDDGANVFNFYDNFAGTSLPNGWRSGAVSGSSVTVNNGLTISGDGSDAGSTYVATTSVVFNNNNILEGYINQNSGVTINERGMIGISTVNNAEPVWDKGGTTGDTIAGWSAGKNGVANIIQSETVLNGAYTYLNSIGSNSNWNIYGVSLSSNAGITTYVNYGDLSSTTSENPSAPLYINLGVVSTGDGSSFNLQYTWIRIRAYPPNGVMPSVTFGSVA